MSKMFCAVYGNEWFGERSLAIGKLRDMHLELPRKFTLSFIKDAWGTLNHRRGQELRELTNLIRLHAKVERPTFEQIKMIGLTVLQTTGAAVFQRPKAFDLVDPSGYFRAEIVRRMIDDKELPSWSIYHTGGHGQRNVRDRAGAVGDNPQVLPGPPMTPAERRTAGPTAPKTADGRTVCWGYNSHMGCVDNGCPRAH